MFTGIIEEVGIVRSVVRRDAGAVLTIDCHIVLEDIFEGASIAVNGVCLTVTSFTANSFCAEAVHETLRRSSLGSLISGAAVNLERAVAANGRLGGHLVSGHIDGTGKISRIRPDGMAVWYTVTASEKLMRYIVEKGSVALDGISLTVAEVGEHSFSVSVIAHTLTQTTLSRLRQGDVVNIENDCIAKYIEKFVCAYLGVSERKSGITESFLAGHGF